VYSLSRRRAHELRSVNVDGTAVAIDIARQVGASLVHTSSVATMGIPSDGTHGDEETPQPASQVIGAYKRSKVDAESLVRRAAATGLEAYVVNPTAPIGPGDHRPTPPDSTWWTCATSRRATSWFWSTDAPGAATSSAMHGAT
jgi:dihydroflavonol-4-reductase